MKVEELEKAMLEKKKMEVLQRMKQNQIPVTERLFAQKIRYEQQAEKRKLKAEEERQNKLQA